MSCVVAERPRLTKTMGDTYMRRFNRLRVLSLAVTAAVVSACSNGTGDEMQGAPVSAAPSGVVTDTRLNARAAPPGITVEKIDRRLQGASGSVDVWVTIDSPSLAAQQAKLAATAGVERAKQLS